MHVEYNEAKFTELVVMVAERLRHDRVGGTSKLARVLYFSDFAHMRRYGRVITGASYVRHSSGPAPLELRQVRDHLLALGRAAFVPESFLGYESHRLLPLDAPDLSAFSAEEIATTEGVLADLSSLTGKQVDDLAQGEPGWRCTREGDIIPYESAWIARRQVVTPTARRMAERVAAEYGIVVNA